MKSCDKTKSKKQQRRSVLKHGANCKGLKASQLVVNKRGTVVSSIKRTQGSERYNQLNIDGPKGWNDACKETRNLLGYWPVPIKKGTEFYDMAKKIFEESKKSYIAYEKPLYSPFVVPNSPKTKKTPKTSPKTKKSPKTSPKKRTVSKTVKKSPYKTPKYAQPVKRSEEMPSVAPKASVSKSGPPKKLKYNSNISLYSPFKM